MNVLKVDLKRACLNKRFLLIVMATVLLWFFNTRRFVREQDVLAIFYAAVGRSTITYVLIVVCGAVYGLSICEEMQDGGIRNTLCRVSLKRYVISKTAVCMLSTVAAYCMGTLGYLGVEMTQHPLVAVNSWIVENLKELTTFHVLLPEHTLAFILLQTVLNGVCCGCMAIMAMGLSPYLRDGFLVLCFPAVLYFILLFVTQVLLHLPVDSESVFWMTDTTKPCVVFLGTVCIYVLIFSGISAGLLYKGIKKYEYE